MRILERSGGLIQIVELEILSYPQAFIFYIYSVILCE